jgi:hypothetical protein
MGKETDLSDLTPAQRAQLFRERAHELRLKAAQSCGEERETLITVAENWELLAYEAELEGRNSVSRD